MFTCLVKFLVALSRGRLASLDSEKLHSSMVLILAIVRHTPELVSTTWQPPVQLVRCIVFTT